MGSYIQTVRRSLANGGWNEHHYLRTPPRLRHILGHRVRLSNNREEAEREARRILTTEVLTVSGSNERLSRFAKRAHDNAFARANKKGKAYELSREIIIKMVIAQDFTCALSGLPFSLEWEDGKNPFAPSLDRIDNSGGYTEGNVRIVLSAVNFGMNTWGLDIYAMICAAVANKQNKMVSFDVNIYRKPVNGVSGASVRSSVND